MTLPDLGKGIYARGGVYWLNHQVRGKRKFVSLKTADPTTALALAGRLRQEQGAGTVVPKNALRRSVEDYIAARIRLNEYTKATARVHGRALRLFTAGLPATVTLPAVTSAHAAAHYRRLQESVAETTAQIDVRALRAFFNWCVENRRCHSNPFLTVKLARIKLRARARQRWCSEAERDGLIAGAPDDDLRFILFCGFHAGLRKNEIVEARVNWFDLRPGGGIHVHESDTFVPKDRDNRHVPLTGAFREFLGRYLTNKAPEGFALRPWVKHGKGTYRYDFHRPYNDYLKEKGMRWATAHVMRHTFTSLLVQAGVSVFKVAQWLGDGVEVVEGHYGHLSRDDRDIERMLTASPSGDGPGPA